MELNLRTTIIGIIILISIIVLLNSLKGRENYVPQHIPDRYEERIYRRMKEDHDFDKYSKIKYCYGNLAGCRQKLKELQHLGGRWNREKMYCDACMKSLGNQEDNTRLYYAKFREYQDKLARCQNRLNFTREALNNCKRKLILCTRELTLKPIVAKYRHNYDLTANSITGNALETQYKSSFDEPGSVY